MTMLDAKKVSEALLRCADGNGCMDGNFNPLCPYVSDYGCDMAQMMLDAHTLLEERSWIEKCGWISVKDRLPEDEGDVLVYGISPRGRKKTAIMNYLAFEDDRPRWALDGIWTVLYWMPLPEPPKEVEDK